MSARNGNKKPRNEFPVNVYRWPCTIKIDAKSDSTNYTVLIAPTFLPENELKLRINF